MNEEQKSKTISARKTRIDVDSKKSERSGLAGLLETVLRSFRDLTHLILILPLYALGAVIIGIACIPSYFIFTGILAASSGSAPLMRAFALGTGLGLSYLAYGFTLLLVIPAVNFLLRTYPREWRGPYYSLETIKWYIHNGSLYLARYTFLEAVTPTPFSLFFYRAMGMKIGKGTAINTTAISDPPLIQLGEKVTLGGSVTLVGHYGQGGFLILSPVIIEDRATIGLRSIVMGGVRVGAGAKILPNSVLLPKTQVPAGETWGGVPAVKISGPET
jgi:acetyltransferase-like isoleucine patch superfamily enzyme